MYWIGMATFPDKKTAQTTAQKLLENRLIACANMVSDVESHYLENGKTKQAKETILFFKTRAEQATNAIRFLEEHHPYQTPVIETWSTGKTNAKAAQWVLRETNWPKKK